MQEVTIKLSRMGAAILTIMLDNQAKQIKEETERNQVGVALINPDLAVSIAHDVITQIGEQTQKEG